MATTIFTWGYYGWGNATPSLVKSVDAVERSRGFQPPIFVDIRIRRSVRAKGFVGNNFEKLLGAGRYRWMRSLGNKRILSGSGGIEIAEPAAANELLDLALETAKEGRRLLFFCGCQWPRSHGEIACHRTTVADLVLEAAGKRGLAVEIVEWPGGEPQSIALPIELGVTPQIFAAVGRGRKTVPLGKGQDLAHYAGMPWCSIATLRSQRDSLRRIVGPALRQPDQWVLPILPGPTDPSASLVEYEAQADKLRRDRGLNAASSGR